MPVVEVRSDIAGKVWKIEAESGAQLEEGDEILILESMKMEIPVMAPVAGRLADLQVEEGDMVPEGAVVATLET